MAKAHPQHFPTLDGVRGFAACVVVISHSAYLGLLPVFLGDRFGQQAVLLFFTLSGFLMFHLYGRLPFKVTEIARYARHRVGRVVPLFYLVVLLSWMALRLKVHVGAFPIDTQSILLQHLFFLNGVSSLWTVPVEIQFYLVFLLLWLAHTRGKFLAALVVIEVVALVFIAAQYLWSLNTGMLPLTMQYFLSGAFIATITDRRPDLRQILLPYAKWLALVIVLFAVLSSSIVRAALKLHMAPTWWDPILAGLPVLIFIGALVPVRPFDLFATPALRRLGQISYGIYIFHFPVLETLTQHLAPQGFLPKLGTLLLVWAVTVGIAFLSYVAFERPLRKAIARDGRNVPAQVDVIAA
jgi:peptidoglycan/LPS O-acetylase OafA/YrhL